MKIGSRTSTFERFVFLDFEASSLDSDSWPIEVGISWIDANLEVQTFASLIRPVKAWPETSWSPASGFIHNIPRHQLDDAPKVREVSTALLKALDGRIAISDCPRWERYWLDRLFDAAGEDTHVQIEDFEAVTLAAFSPVALDYLYERLDRLMVPRRAGLDSARLASLQHPQPHHLRVKLLRWTTCV